GAWRRRRAPRAARPPIDRRRGSDRWRGACSPCRSACQSCQCGVRVACLRPQTSQSSVIAMDPLDPVVAHQIVIEYARNLERDVTEERLPARADSLPYAKPIIKTAISTSVRHLATTGQLTTELRDYLETAYTCLAEYLDGELVDLITTYRRSG